MLPEWKPGAVSQYWCSWKCEGPGSSPALQTKAELSIWLSLSMPNRHFYFQGPKYYVSYNQQITKEHDNIKAISNKSFSFFLELHTVGTSEHGLYSLPPSQSALKMIQCVLCVLIDLSTWVYTCVQFFKTHQL